LPPKSRANNSITWYASHALSKRNYDWTERPDAPRYDHRACHAAHDGKKRTKLHRLIKNLITKATTADDVLYTNGNIIKEGTSGLSAIQEIINRLEGTPSQKITGPRRRHVELDWMGRWVPICVDELPALAGWRLVAKIKHMVCHLLYNTVQLGARCG
jgi:hypothetical protein